MKPFRMLSAAFWLLALIVAVQMIATLAAIAGCFWIVIVMQRAALGGCATVGDQVRQVWAEALTTVLALLLAARPPGNGKPPDQEPP